MPGFRKAKHSEAGFSQAPAPVQFPLTDSLHKFHRPASFAASRVQKRKADGIGVSEGGAAVCSFTISCILSSLFFTRGI